MPKKKNNSVIGEVSSSDLKSLEKEFMQVMDEVQDSFRAITKITADFGREDLNTLRDKINEIIEKYK